MIVNLVDHHRSLNLNSLMGLLSTKNVNADGLVLRPDDPLFGLSVVAAQAIRACAAFRISCGIY
jgi:hypothetical protein